MTDDGDEVIEQVILALRRLPMVDDAARVRVLVAVAAEREAARVGRDAGTPPRSSPWLFSGGALAAAVLIGALLFRLTRPVDDPQPGVASAIPSSSAARLASHDQLSNANVAEPVRFTLRAPAASRVRVVGDFNAWDAERAPMTREGKGDVWSVTLSLRPGRHIYAFVVNDSIWLADPRAPAAPDPDFGRPGSVVLVGHP